MTTTPRTVTVVVPTCDRPDMLRRALASIRALEAPDLHLEIIVGDNGSIDIRPIVEEFGGVYVRVDRSEAAPSRNAGVRRATGEFITFLDDDDEYLTTHLRPHIAMLDARPDLDAVMGQVIYTDADLRPLGDPFPAHPPGEGDRLLKTMLGGYYSQLGTVVARTTVRDTIGLMDEDLGTMGEDWDWFLRLAQKHKLGFVETPCILFRGRPPFALDHKQIPRSRGSRRVFARHAIRSMRVFSSPLDVILTHAGCQKHYYEYFVDAAHRRALRGEIGAALGSIVNALRIFPIRGAFHLVAPRPLRSALATALIGRSRLASATPGQEDGSGGREP